MTIICEFENKTEQTTPPIVVAYPNEGAPYVLQSCYAFGNRELVDLCHLLNVTGQSMFETMTKAEKLGLLGEHIHADSVTQSLFELMLSKAGYWLGDIDVTG